MRKLFIMLVLIINMIFMRCGLAAERTPILFVPGFGQTQLKAPDKRVIFGQELVTSVAHFQELSLGLDAKTDLVPGDLVDHFAAVGIWKISTGVDGLFKGLTDLGYSKDIDLFIFSYDWRLSAKHNAKELNSYIETGPLKGRKFIIIASNSGGLVAHVFLNSPDYKRNADNVESLIDVGVPILGMLAPIVNLGNGFGPLTNYLFGGLDKIKTTLLSLPIFYEVLPTYKDCCLLGEPSSPSSQLIDLLSEETWNKYLKWLLPNNGEQTEFDMIKKRLSMARETIAILEKPLPPNLQHIVVAADRFDTPSHVYVNAADKRLTYTNGRGDGSVTIESAIGGVGPQVFIVSSSGLLKSDILITLVSSINLSGGKRSTIPDQIATPRSLFSNVKFSVTPNPVIISDLITVTFSATVEEEIPEVFFTIEGDNNATTVFQLQRKAPITPPKELFIGTFSAPSKQGIYKLIITARTKKSSMDFESGIAVFDPSSKKGDPVYERIEVNNFINKIWQNSSNAIVRLTVTGEAPGILVGGGLQFSSVDPQTGVGVIVGRAGETLTALHVVGADSKWKRDRNDVVIGRKVFVDLYRKDGIQHLDPIENGVEVTSPTTDLAMLTLLGRESYEAVQGFKPCPPSVGDEVVLLRWPVDALEPDPVPGIVKPRSKDVTNMIKLSFQNLLREGDSGSPVFEKTSGALLGLLARHNENDQAVGYMIPIEKAKALVPGNKLQNSLCR